MTRPGRWSGAGGVRPIPSRVAGGLLALSLALGAVGGGLAAEGPSRLERQLDEHGVLRWDRGAGPVLVVQTRRGDGWLSIAGRVAAGGDVGRRLRAANPGLAAPLRDRPVLVPVEILRDELRLDAVRALFPIDGRVVLGWQHWVLDPFGGGEESWEWLGLLFCGSAEAATDLKRANPELAASPPRRGRPVLIPEARLLKVFRDQPAPRPTPPSPTPTAMPTPTPSPVPAPSPPPTVTTVDASAQSLREAAPVSGVLDYGVDADGGFAIYRLRQGEALYSAVVVRFTGQLSAAQVNATAADIARRSGIADVTSIPVGFPIRIPLELLLPEHLPAGDPRRVAWERERAELGGFLELVRAADLAGVHVVLDAGHGGSDSGAVVDGVWEAPYVYDIVCRVRRALEKHTKATVWVTRNDRRWGLEAQDRDRLEHHRQQYLLTRPPYDLGDSVIGVHLRWYLTNDIILNRLGSQVPRAKTVFVSIHADSLHPSVRGAMVYVPSRHLRPPRYTAPQGELRRFAEYRNHPTVRFGDDFKARVEASSQHLAENLISRYRANRIAVHPHRPVRDRVLRGQRGFVPAVLKYTAAQNAVLVECGNLANDEDRRRIVDASWRESFARATVEGLSAAFSGGE